MNRSIRKLKKRIRDLEEENHDFKTENEYLSNECKSMFKNQQRNSEILGM